MCIKLLAPIIKCTSTWYVHTAAASDKPYIKTCYVILKQPFKHNLIDRGKRYINHMYILEYLMCQGSYGPQNQSILLRYVTTMNLYSFNISTF